MDIDKFSYIFGSFARRRQNQEQTSIKRRSIEPITMTLSSPSHSKKQMIQLNKKTKSALGINIEETKYRCPICKKQFEDPRVLPCLHTFCLKCLEDLERTDSNIWSDNDSEAQKTDEAGSRKASSAGSGYVSDRQDDLSPGKGFCCPSCGSSIDLPKGGVAALLPNYLLQRKMTLLNLEHSENLCDICTSDKSALFRCIVCKLNLCDICEEIHQLQKTSAGHEIYILEDVKEKEAKKLKQSIMCVRHQGIEMTIFCTSCYQVICKECVTDFHLDHIYEPLSKAIKAHITKLRLLVDKANNVVEDSAVATSKLNAASKNIDSKCTEVQEDVEKFIEEYIQSVEDHKIGLLEQIKQVKEEKLQTVAKEKHALQLKIRNARDISYFLTDLLNDGTDAETLTFLQLIQNKVEKCGNFEPPTELKLSGSLQFLKEETVKCPNNFFTIYGVLTTQSVSSENCILNTSVLQNLRVGKRIEVLLETRDNDDMPIERGGEEVTADIRHREAGISKSVIVHVKDKRNGTYIISFVPDVPGKLLLNVNINGQPVKGSPFPVNVRTIKQHIGIYHCCTFCSSKGSKEAICGCSGKMAGGYKGCGHGHEGHPGRRHWSCCGIILEHSECTRTKQNNY